MLPQHAVLQDLVAKSMASEYIAFSRWAKTRNLVYVPSVADFFATRARDLGIAAATIETHVCALEHPRP